MANEGILMEKVVVITGGSSGLGLALAGLFCELSVNVILIARDKNKLETAKSELEARHANAKISLVSLDILDESKVNDAMNAIEAQFGRIDILINSAGILAEDYVENLTIEVFEKVMNTNYLGTVICTKAALPALKKSNGHLVNIASMAAIFGAFGYTSYCASKFAVLGFTEALRLELKPQGIDVTVVCPPEFDGPMVEAIADSRTAEGKYLAQSAGVMTAEQVAKETFAGIKKKKAVLLVGRNSKILAGFNRWFPSLSRFFSHAMVAKVYKGPSLDGG